MSVPEDHLPECDDPFELLGLDLDATQTDARRAYVRLIKRFRPEHDPESFQRIQKAYQEVRWQLQSEYEYDEDDEDDAEEGPGAWPLSGDPSVRGRLQHAWQRFAEEEPAAAAEELRELCESHPTDPTVWVHAYLCADLRADTEAPRHLYEGLQAGAGLVVPLMRLTSEEERRPFGGSDALQWSLLRRQFHDWAVSVLYGERVQHHCLAGRASSLVDEMLEPDFLDDAERLPALQGPARLVMAITAWDDPDAAERLHAHFPHDESDAPWEFTPGDGYDLAMVHGGAWRAAIRYCPDVGALRRYIEVGTLLPPDEAVPVAYEARTSFASRPAPSIQVLTALEGHPETLGIITSLLERMQRPADNMVMSVPYQQLRAVEDTLAANPRASGKHWLVSIALFATFRMREYLGWLTVAIMGGLVFIGLRNIWREDHSMFRAHMRMPLGRMIGELGCTVDDLLSAIKYDKGSLTKVDRYTVEIGNDPVLVACERLANVGQPAEED